MYVMILYIVLCLFWLKLNICKGVRRRMRAIILWVANNAIQTKKWCATWAPTHKNESITTKLVYIQFKSMFAYAAVLPSLFYWQFGSRTRYSDPGPRPGYRVRRTRYKVLGPRAPGPRRYSDPKIPGTAQLYYLYGLLWLSPTSLSKIVLLLP